ncbi:hypothetical protein KOW79_020511 [Hemibagrus wyckioides]|uniref:Uncharacterized protein n=1 Tax=Hemibagrus wyckioides TaxID=337641 RepID=A0A9D3N700_9TELE|nr:hypothetical protein KOW79_020511 [Hemibagrus wyckioides]
MGHRERERERQRETETERDRERDRERESPRLLAVCVRSKNYMMGNHMSGNAQEMSNTESDHFTYIYSNKRFQDFDAKFQDPDSHQSSIQRFDVF